MRIVMRAAQAATVALSTAVALSEPLAARALMERCEAFTRDPSSLSGALCESYIRGFLAGLSVERRKESAQGESRESFADRAARARIGMRLAARGKANVCLAEETRMDQLVDRLIAHAGLWELDRVTARDLLRRMLTVEYPCER